MDEGFIFNRYGKDTLAARFLNSCIKGKRNDVISIINSRKLDKVLDIWNYGLYYTSYVGNKELTSLLINKGTDMEFGLCRACEGGHKDIVLLLINTAPIIGTMDYFMHAKEDTQT